MRLRFSPPLMAMVLAAVLATTGWCNTVVTSADSDATAANITRLTTNILEHSQFSQRPFDTDLAGKFLDRYLDSLDNKHVLFLQSDLEEFAPYRATLVQAMRSAGDTSTGKAVFNRYLVRLKQRTDYLTERLKSEKFDFAGNDVYSFDRETATRPADIIAAHALWEQQLRAEYLQEKLSGKKPEAIVSDLTRRYSQLVQNMNELSQGEILEGYLDALAHVYDPHSDYLGHEQYDNFSINMNLSLCGIGATLESEDGYCTVLDLVPGGPAARSGLLKPGDQIVAVAQKDKEPVSLVSLPASRAVELIRGAKGTVVTLTIIPSGMSEDSVHRTITLVRDEIKLADQQAKAQIIDLPNDQGQPLRLGVIDLPSFYADMSDSPGTSHRSASKDVATLLGKMKEENIHGVILDLRNNGGGSLQEAIKLAGLFIPSGPVVQTKGPQGDIAINSDPHTGVFYDGPLIVLINRFSASASEIVAGALQDYGRAIIAGDSTTFGKGTVQAVLPLAPLMDQNSLGHSYDPGALKLTIRKFYRPSGASTQLKGVASDIVLPSLSDFSDVNESALKDPLPWDIVPSAKYRRLNLVEPYLAELREKSSRRIASAKDFTLLQEEFAEFQKRMDAKSVSLNEAQRRTEMAEAKSIRNEFDKESLALSGPTPTSYEITLANATVPGLPRATSASSPVIKAHAKEEGTIPEALEPLDADSSPAHDIILSETEHILADYVTQLQHPSKTSL